ncbi:MAG: beta-galactosidase [Thermomicrobiales bacterium]
MLRRMVLALVLMVTVGGLAGSLAGPTAVAQEDLRSPRYFDTTGFWVQGPFREYWETRGGLFVFGLPITGVFQDSDGFYKQYFERSIFEYHPVHANTEYEVLLQRLGAIRVEGRESEEPFVRIDGITPDENCDYYPETGHRLCFGIRAFWYNNGGLPNFGYPLSEEFDERNQPPPAGDGEIHTVQYFERARIEWHPEFQGTEYEFLLGLLGTEYLEEHGAPAAALERQSPDNPPSDPTAFWWSDPGFRYGFNISWAGDDQGEAFNQKTMGYVDDAGFNSVRIQAFWSVLEPVQGQYDFRPLERLLSVSEQHQQRVLVSIVRSPQWALPEGEHEGIPVDTAPFEEFMRELTSTFGGRVDAWEIWNEQNLAFETGGFVDAGRYVELLKAGHRGAKAGYAPATIVFGGLTPTGVNDPTIAIDDANYLQQIYDYNGGEVKDYYDVLGTHPGSNNNSPDQFWPDNPGPDGWSDHRSFYFRRIEDIRAVMVANGEGDKPIWVTEFGWTTENQAPGYEYGADNSEADQAAYLTRAFEIARTEWPYVTAMYVWNLNFAVVVEPGDEKAPWGVLYSDWSPRPAYDALRDMPKN